MGDHNSLEVYTSLFQRLLCDIADCYPESEPKLDWAKAQSRFVREGISFFTKSLPRLGKAFDKALQGESRLLCDGFKSSHGVPKFLGWLLKRVFTDEGYIRGDADVQAIKHFRQLVFLLYKLELPYDPKTTKKVIDSFISVDEEIKNLSINPDDAIINRARRIISRVLAGSCPRSITPRHGPGSVSTGEIGGRKSSFRRLYKTLEPLYPFTEYFRTSMSHVIDSLDEISGLEVLDAGTAKVVLVPKDSRGPRLISCEPLELQWIQQGQQRKLYDTVENHWITSGFVNFTNQEVNRSLALSSSLDGEWVTLDMKDASDRVGLALVKLLFDGTNWYDHLFASRSQATRLPDGSVRALSKFAPMGSAVCFPIEALCFYALAVSVLQVKKNYSFEKSRRSVFVYGDDIICRTEDYSVVMQSFPAYGLMFNAGKCCTAGFFRESCGCDAYKGVDVTPIRLRTVWNHRSQWNATQLVSYTELSNSMYAAGYRGAAQFLESLIESLYGPLPILEYRRSRSEPSQAYYTTPGRVIGLFRPDVNPIQANRAKGIKTRFSSSVHKHEVFGYAVQSVHKYYPESGWDAILRNFCCGSTGLPRGIYAVARRSRLKRKWGTSGL